MAWGLTVIVTRPQPDAGITALRLKDRGHTPMISPALEFQPLSTGLPDPAKLTGLVVTSSNALRALSERGVLEDFRRLPVWTVGDATAETARALGFETVTSAEGTATELAVLLKKRKPLRLFYAAARHTAADLVAMLRAAGHFVISCPVYDMRPVPNLETPVILALEAGRIDAALFYSARSAECFADAALRASGAVQDLASFCLSPTVAEALQKRGFTRAYAAPKPTETALLDLLDTFAAGQFSP